MDNAKQTDVLQKGQRFKATDMKGRAVTGLVLDVFPWSQHPYKCDAVVQGVRRIEQFNIAEFQPSMEVLQ